METKQLFNRSDPNYKHNLMKHFYHNREWWRSHCRMYIPKSLQHAYRVKRIVSTMEKEEYLSTLLTDELRSYFESFEKAILRGEFEEQTDVPLFIKTGEDSNGLPCYLRLRGTVRTENLHQKMKTAIGPWAVGACTGHMLLVLTCYRYNIKSLVRRCGAYNFGHCELHLIDRIQIRVKEIFNILVWPRHTNMTYFSGKETSFPLVLVQRVMTVDVCIFQMSQTLV